MKKWFGRMWRAVRAAFPITVPVLTAFIVIGLAYGILMATHGFGPLWSALWSAVAFCGGMQFVAIPYLAGSFAPLQVFLLGLMVNARHLFYGLSMLDKYKGAGKAKGFLIYTLCDENFAIQSTAPVPEGVNRIDFFVAVSALNYLYWVCASFLGGVVGNLLTFDTTGLDFALTALFVVMFIEQIHSRENAVCGTIGILSAFLALLLFGAENMVIPAMLLIVAALLVGRRQLCD